MSARRPSRSKRRPCGGDREEAYAGFAGPSSPPSLRSERYGGASSSSSSSFAAAAGGSTPRNTAPSSRIEGCRASHETFSSQNGGDPSLHHVGHGAPSSLRSIDPSRRKDSSWMWNGNNRGNRSPRSRPAGLIFLCSSYTKRDCFRFKVFGLPLAKKDLVEEVVPGTFLFLYDFDAKRLYGVYEAVSRGGLNLEPDAFQGQGSYPSQVKFDIYRDCLPLTEAQFKEAIIENYYSRNKFSFELSYIQVERLLKLFCPTEPVRERINLGMDRNEAKALSRPCLSDRRDTNQSRVELLARDPQHRVPPETIRIKEVGRHLPAAGLVDRSASGPLHLDLVQRDALQRGLPQVLRIDDRVPWQVPHQAVGISEATYLPQIRVLDGRADQEGLLSEGCMNEVDELALKYLQQSRNSLDMRGRNSTVLLSEAGVLRNGFISSFDQDAAIRDASLQAQYGTAVKGEHGITLRMEHDIALTECCIKSSKLCFS